MDIFRVVTFIVLFILIISQFAHMKKTMEVNEKLKRIVQESNEQYQEVIEVNKSLRNIRHDINKQRTVVNSISQDESVDIVTGIPVIDRILYIKGKEINNKGIEFKVDAERLSDMNIGDGAIISIFTNILDNAIEACESIDKPWIKCNIRNDFEHKLHMIVENSKSEEIKIDESNIVTSKTEKELHGYGLSIIKELIKRNQGTISIEDKGCAFSLEIKV